MTSRRTAIAAIIAAITAPPSSTLLLPPPARSLVTYRWKSDELSEMYGKLVEEEQMAQLKSGEVGRRIDALNKDRWTHQDTAYFGAALLMLSVHGKVLMPEIDAYNAAHRKSTYQIP